MSDEITRQEYNESLNRFHTRVDEISKCSIEVKVSVKNMENMVKDIHTCMYGNGGKDGIVTKVATIFQTLGIHFKLIWIIVAGLFSLAFFVIKQIFSK